MTARDGVQRESNRIDLIWLLLPYVLLLVSAAYTVVAGGVSAEAAPRTVIAGAVLVAWHAFWTFAHRDWLEQKLLPMAVYFAGLVALCAVLLEVSVSFLGLYLACYAMAFVALPGLWAYVGLGVATAVPLLFTGARGWQGTDLAVTLGGLAVAAAIGWSIRRLEAESHARRVALQDLARAHDDLERALDDNRSLQDRLVAEARESGVVTERSRIAAEMHDTLAAALAGIVSQLEAADADDVGVGVGRGGSGGGDSVGTALDESTRARLRTSIELARDGLREARHSIQALRPAVLTGRGLPAAVSALVDEFEHTSRVPSRAHVTGTPTALPEHVEDELIRIGREALTNVRRHAGAGRVHVTLSYLGDAVALDVADDGRGFDHDPLRGHGLEGRGAVWKGAVWKGAV